MFPNWSLSKHICHCEMRYHMARCSILDTRICLCRNQWTSQPMMQMVQFKCYCKWSVCIRTLKRLVVFLLQIVHYVLYIASTISGFKVIWMYTRSDGNGPLVVFAASDGSFSNHGFSTPYWVRLSLCSAVIHLWIFNLTCHCKTLMFLGISPRLFELLQTICSGQGQGERITRILHCIKEDW